jgi:hypothetical protein
VVPGVPRGGPGRLLVRRAAIWKLPRSAWQRPMSPWTASSSAPAMCHERPEVQRRLPGVVLDEELGEVPVRKHSIVAAGLGHGHELFQQDDSASGGPIRLGAQHASASRRSCAWTVLLSCIAPSYSSASFSNARAGARGIAEGARFKRAASNPLLEDGDEEAAEAYSKGESTSARSAAAKRRGKQRANFVHRRERSDHAHTAEANHFDVAGRQDATDRSANPNACTRPPRCDLRRSVAGPRRASRGSGCSAGCRTRAPSCRRAASRGPSPGGPSRSRARGRGP